MNLEALDWAALERLRTAFLSGSAGKAAYWTSLSDLASYDATFAERIGWKWDAVLAELSQSGWKPPVGAVYDLGCGSGIAGRRLVRTWGGGRLQALRVSDRSPLAEQFAIDAAQREFPGLEVTRFDASVPPPPGAGATLVISHVLNELPPAARTALVAWIGHFDAVLWVEPGTHADSQALIDLRESLRSQFHLISPCPHQDACGLRAPDRQSDWCHFFAAPPPGIFADGDWVRFGQRMGIDLRGLPYSYLVLQRRDSPQGHSPNLEATKAQDELAARLLGSPRFYKGYAKLFFCRKPGVEEVVFQKRANPALFKRLERQKTGTQFRIRMDGSKVADLQEIPTPGGNLASSSEETLVP